MMSHLIKIYTVCKFSYFCIWYLKELKLFGIKLMDTISKNAPCLFSFLPTFSKGTNSLRKELAPMRANSFL